MHLVAEVVAFGGVLVDVFHGPGAGDDGLHAEDVGVGAVYLRLHYTGDIGLEFHIIDDLQVSPLVHADGQVAFVCALLDVAGIEAEDAGGVVGDERDIVYS